MLEVWIWELVKIKKDSPTLRCRAHFHNLAHISGKTNVIVVKYLLCVYVSLDEEFPIKSLEVIWIWTGFTPPGKFWIFFPKISRIWKTLEIKV